MPQEHMKMIDCIKDQVKYDDASETLFLYDPDHDVSITKYHLRNPKTNNMRMFAYPLGDKTVAEYRHVTLNVDSPSNPNTLPMGMAKVESNCKLRVYRNSTDMENDWSYRRQKRKSVA